MEALALFNIQYLKGQDNMEALVLVMMEIQDM